MATRRSSRLWSTPYNRRAVTATTTRTTTGHPSGPPATDLRGRRTALPHRRGIIPTLEASSKMLKAKPTLVLKKESTALIGGRLIPSPRRLPVVRLGRPLKRLDPCTDPLTRTNHMTAARRVQPPPNPSTPPRDSNEPAHSAPPGICMRTTYLPSVPLPLYDTSTNLCKYLSDLVFVLRYVFREIVVNKTFIELGT